MFSVEPSSPERKVPYALTHRHADLRHTGPSFYLTGSERAAFRTAAEAAPREVRTYCWTLLYTGCRPALPMYI